MTPDEFRRWGYATVDWVAGYFERVEGMPVLSRVEPGDIRAQLPDAAPEQGEPFDDLLRDLDAWTSVDLVGTFCPYVGYC
jgi:aromatic-L-amino-acid decarboxylase